MQNRFEKYSKVTILVSVAVIFVILLLITERFLSLQDKTVPPTIERYIRLMEVPPRTIIHATPAGRFLANRDSLVQREYVFRTDDNGFIMPSKIHDSPDVVIAFLGGSTTECAWMDENERFPYLAGRLLEKETGLKINSYNAAMSGANSLHDINILLNKVMPLKPDIVIMMENINDLVILIRENSHFNSNPGRSLIGVMNIATKPSIRGVWRQIRDLTVPHVYQRANSIIHEIRHPEPVDDFKDTRTKKIVIDQPHILREFRMNLQTYIAICKARNVVPVLMTQENRIKTNPDKLVVKSLRLFRNQDTNYEEGKDIYDRMNQAIRDVGVENGVTVIDLAAQIPQEKEYMYDLVHFNGFGSRTAAGIISKELKPIIFSLKNKWNKIG